MDPVGVQTGRCKAGNFIPGQPLESNRVVVLDHSPQLLRRLLRTECHEKQQRQGSEPARYVGEQLGRRLVEPLGVVDD
jgi:hypothetical protein